MITLDYYRGDCLWVLAFPLEELGNAIAICGWVMTNNIRKTDEVQRELDRLYALESLPIPDSREWFRKFATRR